MTTPVLTATRLVLEPFSERFLTRRYVAWLNDPDVTRFSEQRHRRHTIESCKEYLESYRDTPNHFWAIVASGLGHVGNINAMVDVPNAVADVGILIGEKTVWGNGYGREAWQAVLSFLLSDGGLRKATAGTMETNAGMRRLMAVSGMREEGRRLRQFQWEGREVDLVLAAAFRAPN